MPPPPPFQSTLTTGQLDGLPAFAPVGAQVGGKVTAAAAAPQPPTITSAPVTAGLPVRIATAPIQIPGEPLTVSVDSSMLAGLIALKAGSCFF